MNEHAAYVTNDELKTTIELLRIIVGYYDAGVVTQLGITIGDGIRFSINELDWSAPAVGVTALNHRQPK